ncbi:MAG: MFS transporter [Deltaproteobacteria bacterium]|nr:MFS transporter [Deltaproteobacteria bacterium]MBW2359620.1 MFS transporter [Deltaproteobacteria bacterium]
MAERADAGHEPGDGAGEVEEVSPREANYVLGVLFLVYVVNFIDRQVLSVFIGPIKEEFAISDTEVGLLVGFAFALFYTIAGIPIARWADRGNRRSIIAIGLTVWSAMTVACGLTRNFAQLALVRIGVGVGEAAGSPPAHSLISDYFAPQRRATALGIYASGVYVGSALAYLGGGYLRANFDWRTAFFVLGAPGLLLALVVRFTVREPPRGYSERATGQAVQTSTFGETLRYLLSCRSWVRLVVGASFISLMGYGVLMWGFEFYGRVHGLSPIEIGSWMAVIVGIGGSAGAYLGGALADRLGQRDPAWYMRLPAIVTLIALPFGFVFLLADSSRVSMLFFFAFYLLSNVYVPTIHTLNQNLSKLRMRATASAILLFIINIVGAGAGPFVVGFLNDQYAAHFGGEAIRYSLLTLATTGVLGAFFFHRASRSLPGDLARHEV